MSTSLFYDTFRQPSGYTGKLAGWLMTSASRERSSWTISQLDIQPYQRILEVGYGPGNALQLAARQLKVGFLAGIDHSLAMYEQAFRRNKQYIEQQLLQLHIGELYELSYPPFYFDTVYGSNVHLFWKDPQSEFIRLAHLLKCGGRMVITFQPRRGRNDETIHIAAEQLEADLAAAGLTNTHISYKDMFPTPCVSVTGFKP